MSAKPKKKTETASAGPAEAISKHLGARVKQLRGERGWSLEQLAAASGVSRSMLSQIEREEANPTLAVTLRIAQAFAMNLGDLIEMPGATSAVSVIRAEDHAFHYRSDKFCRIRTLSPLKLEKDVEFYEVQLQPGVAGYFFNKSSNSLAICGQENLSATILNADCAMLARLAAFSMR